MIANSSTNNKINDYQNTLIGKTNNNPEATLIKSINEFSFRLYSQSFANVNKNQAFSPLTIYNILNLLSSCSNESTHIKLKRLLGIENTDHHSIALSNLVEIETTADKIESKWDLITREGFLKAEYIDKLKANEPRLRIHQSSNELDDKLNEHFNLKTRELALIFDSSVEFGLEWKVEFKSANEKGAFQGPMNQSFEINLMKIPNQKFMYCKNPLGLPLKICEYPIGDRDDLAFVIILPARNSLQLIESQLNAALFEQLLAEMRPVELNSTLPVFTIHHRLDLRRVLIELGLSEMCEFSSRGNGLYASDAFCESSIKVGSKRIEARQHDCFLMRRGDEEINNQAPITDINVNKASANKECFCENPFLFLIRNKRNRLILFMGKLVVPIDK